MPMGIYQAIYDLIATYIYGGVALTPSMILVNTTVSTIGCLFILAIPFIVTYFVIRLVCSAFERMFGGH